MKNLTDWFTKVYLLNCRHRPDRLELALQELERSGMADIEKVIVYPAVAGKYTSYPADWHSGAGSWGCLRSYQRMLEDCLHEVGERDKLLWDSVLFLEDDVFFLPNALEDLNKFMPLVPDDWGQIYLGGQHWRPAEKFAEGVLLGRSVNRTHAFAVSSTHVHRLYRHISYATDYRDKTNHQIDHQLEIAHRRHDWPVYCPEKWICGQRAGISDISGQDLKELTWQ